MYISRSLLASAVVLSFCTQIGARVTHQDSGAERDLVVAHGQSNFQGLLERWPLNKVFGKRQTAGPFTDVQCPTDDLYVEILDSAPTTAVQTLCNNLLGIPPATVIITTSAVITNVTSGTATSTQTVQLSSTQTVTATITPAAALRREVNAAAQIAVANSIMADVIVNGANAAALAAATPNEKQEEALSGFENACSCETVAPTSTTTVISAINQTLTETTTVTPGSNQTTNSVPASITSPPSVSVVTSGSVLPISSFSASPGSPERLVIGVPFNCPKDGTPESKANGLSPEFIVGDLRFQYSVLCDTTVTDNNPLAGIQNVANQTACAAECSILNNAAQKQLCQTASFVPTPGASDGQCFLYGQTTTFARQPGSVTIILTAVASKSDRCQSVDLANGPSNTSVDTAQLIGDVITGGFSLSTPGLVTRSETGGVYKTFWSSGSTDSNGAYHFTWFEVYASSSAWWAAYATSWSCTVKNTPRTVVIPQPVVNLTSVYIDVTTIVENGTTTIISGTSTFSRTGGGGVIFPTPVSALGTGGSAAFTTAQSTATSNATAGAGIGGIPSPTSVASGSLAPSSVANQTSIVPIETGSQGAASVTVSGNTSTFSSAEGGGIVPASPTAPPNSTVASSSGSAAFTVSEGTSTSNATAGSGGQPAAAASSGGINFNVSSGLSTGASIGGSGLIPPSPTNGTLAGTGPSSEFVLSTQSVYERPTSSAAASLPVNSTVLIGTGASSAGGTEFTSAGSTFVVLSTGGAGSIGPIPATVNSTQLPSSPAPSVSLPTGLSSPFSPSNGTSPAGTVPASQTLIFNANTSVTEGTAAASVSGATTVVLSTGGSGVILPVSANVSIPAPTETVSETASGFAPTPSSNSTEESSGSFGIFQFSEETTSETTESSEAGTSGAIPLPSGNTSLPASVSASPSPSSNSSLPSGTAIFVTSSGTTISSAASGNGVIPPSVNISATAAPSLSPSLSTNTSVTPVETAPGSSGAQNVSLSGATAITLSTGAGGVILPSTNLTTSAPASLTPSPSANLSSIEENFSNSLRDRTGRPLSRTSTLNGTVPIGTGGSAPVINSTAPPSIGTAPLVTAPIGTAAPVTAPTSAGSSAPVGNSTIPPPPPFIPNGGYGSKSSSAGISTEQPSVAVSPLSANSSAVFPTTSGIPEQPSVSISPLSSNSSTLFPTASGSIEQPSATPAPLSANSSAIFPTASGSVEQPSVTLPPPSANSSAIFPTASGSTGPEFSNSLDNRIGRSRTHTTITSGSPPLNTGNVTLSGTAPLPTANVSLPETAPPSVVIPLSTGAGLNSTQLSGATGSSAVPVLSSAAPVPPVNYSLQATGPSSLPIESANITSAPLVTAPSGTAPSIPTTEGNFTDSEALRRGSLSKTPANSTAFLPTGTASVPPINYSLQATGPSSLPIQSANITSAPLVTAPSGTAPSIPTTEENFTDSEALRRGSLSKTPANSTAFLPTGTASVPPLNYSLQATGPSSLPIQSANITSAPLVTAPSGTAPSILTTEGNFTDSEALRRGSLSKTPANSTAFLPTGTAPVPPLNYSLQATGPSSLPIQSANITSAPLVTAPSGTAPSIPTTEGNFTDSEALRRGSISKTPANSTAFLPTGTAPANTVPVPLNSSAPVGTASGPLLIPLSTGVPSSGVGALSANSSAPVGTASSLPSIPLSTGVTPSLSVASISANSSAPVGTASIPVPLFTAASASIVVASASANSTSVFGTGVVSASPTPLANVSIPLTTGVSVNATASSAVGTGASSGFAPASLNSTYAPSIVTAPSTTPTPLLNSSSEGCPTPTAVIVPHTTVITTVSYETLLVGPSTCAPTASGGLLGFNYTLPTGTAAALAGTAAALAGTAAARVGTGTGFVGTAAAPVYTGTGFVGAAAAPVYTGTAPVLSSFPTAIARSYRRSGEIATQEQINRACADQSNIVINHDFSIEAANTAFGWATNASDPSITFRAENSTNSDGTTSPSARVLATFTGSPLTISQPLTLCTGKQYKLTSSNKVGNLMSKCQADYYIGNNFVYRASPQEYYTRKQDVFTAGITPEQLSPDLRIVVTCNGESGIPAGTDEQGNMSLDINDVTVQQV